MTTIEVFADIWCPFTHVGLRAIDEVRHAAGRGDVPIVCRAWPLELVNGAPMDGPHAAQRAADLRAQVAPEMFARVDTDHFPATTLPALALTARAYRTDIRLGECIAFALRDALFEYGEDIADHRVLERIADAYDVTMPDDDDHAQVLADFDEGRARGVIGSPHFFCAGTDMFCVALDISRRDDHSLAIARDAEGLRAFVERCLSAS